MALLVEQSALANKLTVAAAVSDALLKRLEEMEARSEALCEQAASGKRAVSIQKEIISPPKTKSNGKQPKTVAKVTKVAKAKRRRASSPKAKAKGEAGTVSAAKTAASKAKRGGKKAKKAKPSKPKVDKA